MLLVLISINVYLIINFVGNKITPNIFYVIKKTINSNVGNYVFYGLSKEVMMDEELDDLITVDKNSEGEIIAVDYNFDVAYDNLSESLEILYENLDEVEIDSVYYNKDKQIFFVPLGILTNNVLVSNMGPEIPCKIELLSHVNIGYKTKVSNYGINNALVELYVVISVQNSIINPAIQEDFGEEYEIVLDSKLISGSVPGYYGGVIEQPSAIVSS